MARWKYAPPVAVVALACTAFASGPGGPEEKGALKASTPQKWDVQVPLAPPVKLAAAPGGGKMIPIPHAGGPGFVVEFDGPSLAVDTNGDGKTDEKIKGIGGAVTLKAKTADGKPLTYSVRAQPGADGWTLAPAMVMAGRVAGVEVKLIDLNLNGRFDEVGTDGMIVGSSDSAAYLSKVANLGGKLYELAVTADGLSATATPFTGEAGTLSLLKGWKSESAELAAAVVQNANGDYSFELSDAKAGLLVPAGEYRLVSGFAKKGSESVRIRGGADMKPLVVENGKTAALAWGGPVQMDFSFAIAKDVITVPPDLKYLGAAGEEYFEFKPDAKSPLIVVTDPETKQVVREGRFGGC
jgi:hypothetical protein